MIWGCGADKKNSDKSNQEEPSYTSFYKGGEVTFTKDDVGKNFVLMPFQLGDLSKIEGGNNDNFTFKGQKQTSAGLTIEPNSGAASIKNSTYLSQMSPAEIDHSLRTLLNRFDPSLGTNQGAWFWSLARSLDSALRLRADGSSDSYLTTSSNQAGVEAFYRRAASQVGLLEAHRGSLNLTAGSCPTANVVVPDASDPSETDEAVIPAGGVVSEADFCIVYLSEPKTESSKDKILASVKQILKIYKTVIYKDTFPQASDGYVFKPIFVVEDFGDSSKWSQLKNLQVTGAFVPGPSNVQKQPLIYMSSDVGNVSINKGLELDKDLERRKWHGTLAHELQHAIIDYYRSHRVKGVLETPAVDEGLAHYMEDLFGYGEENFKDFAKAYLDLWAVSNPPVLHASDDEKIERGGAWLFWYYLISQKGGVTFTDGVVSGGEGLEFVRNVVQNASQRGAVGLAAKFGRDWTETVAGFFGAVVVDGSTIPVKPKIFVVQDPQPVVDLTGVTTKKYGMHFNNFGGLAAVRTFSDNMFKSGAALEDVTYYATSPVRLDSPSEGDVVKFQSSSDAPNFAVVKVLLN
jgi:hypothetical protein